jgi:hypothetical protein
VVGHHAHAPTYTTDLLWSFFEEPLVSSKIEEEEEVIPAPQPELEEQVLGENG